MLTTFMTATRRAGPLLALVLSVGCGHGKLVPASSANVVPGAPGAAVLMVDGVRCSADVAAWSSRPGVLPSFVTPVKVRITNSSGTPVRLLYEAFTLVGKSGQKYHPIPVVPIDAEPGTGKLSPMYASSKFYVAPQFHGVYNSLEPWPQPLGRDADLYAREYRRWGHQPPTEVVRKGLPEGVLEDGGVVSGFLYFESPLGREDRVTFHAQFDKSDGQDTIASMKIPFRVQ